MDGNRLSPLEKWFRERKLPYDSMQVEMERMGVQNIEDLKLLDVEKDLIQWAQAGGANGIELRRIRQCHAALMKREYNETKDAPMSPVRLRGAKRSAGNQPHTATLPSTRSPPPPPPARTRRRLQLTRLPSSSCQHRTRSRHGGDDAGGDGDVRDHGGATCTE